MITTYAELKVESKDNWDRAMELSSEEIEALAKDADSLPLNDVRDMLSDYYGIANISDSVIKAVLVDPVIAFDVYMGGTRDTAVRDMIGDALMKYIGLGHWPMYGSSQEYKTQFWASLPHKLAYHGMTVEAGE